MNFLKETDKGLIIHLKIIPNSSKCDIVFEETFLKVKVTAQPIENKANKNLIEYLAKRLHRAKTSIQIVKGETSKEKTIFIEGMTSKDFIDQLS